jgi:large subunit ribosomal protein L31
MYNHADIANELVVGFA